MAKWYEKPEYGNMVGRPPAPRGTATGTPVIPADGYATSPLRPVFGPRRPNMAAAAIHGGQQTVAAMQAGRRRDENATEALNNVLLGRARPLYDDSFQTPYQVNSGHFVSVPGGGFRAHPMAIGAPTRPDPEWQRRQAIRASVTDPDFGRLDAWATQRQATAQARGEGSYDINRNSDGEVTGFTVTGAMPRPLSPRAGASTTPQASQIQLNRLNRDVTDPTMRYTMSADGRGIVDPFGQVVSTSDAASRITAMNQQLRDVKSQRMAETSQARRALDRERQQAAAWNIAMARQISPNHPLSPIAQERAMGAQMPGQKLPQDEFMRGQLELTRQAMQNQNAQQLLQNELLRKRIEIESKIANGDVTPLAKAQMDLQERLAKLAQEERDATRKGQISPAQQARANAFLAAASNPNLSPEQQNQLQQQAFAELGIAAGSMPSPIQLGGGGALAGYPEALQREFKAAKNRNEVWSIGLRSGIFTPKDKDSLAKFQALTKQLELDTPWADFFRRGTPAAMPWNWGQIREDAERINRGERPILSEMQGFR